MAQKTLLIGIGTTGLHICEDVLQRIEDEYGDANKIPWLRAVAFETARVSDADGLMRGHSYDIGIPAEQWQTLKSSPKTYQDRIGFLDWSDDSVIQMANGTTQGAANVRMLGRTSWMFPSSQGLFEGVVQNALTDLVRLTPAEAKAARGPLAYTAEDPDVVFDGVKKDSGDAIVIYVCGSLTGGTCSGAFIDIGYFLQTLNGYRIDAVIGMFGIPHPAYDVDIQVANAYAALRELNHFSRRGQTYDAKFSTRAQPTTVVGKPPFTATFLCQPRHPAPKAEHEVSRSFGQYVYLTALSAIGGATRAELINPSIAIAGTPDDYGNPMDYSTLGVSVIEYPAEHIMTACSHRLAGVAVAQWLGNQGIEPGPAELLLTSDPTQTNQAGPHLNREQITRELLRAQSGQDTFETTVETQVATAVAGIHSGDFATVLAVENNIEGGFKHQQGSTGAVTPGMFVNAIAANAALLIPDRVERTKALFRDRILDGDAGPNFCRDLAKQLKSFCSAWVESISAGSNEAVASLRQGIDTARLRAEDAHETFTLALGWRKTATARCANEYQEAATEYWQARLRHACDTYIEGCAATLPILPMSSSSELLIVVGPVQVGRRTRWTPGSGA